MLAAQVFSGAGLGLLLGLLLGLSSSPVVGVIVGALAAIIASLVGLRSSGKTPEEALTPAGDPAERALAGIRAGVFGFTCVAAVLAGIYLRAHDVLAPPAPSLKQRFDELVAIGFSASDARNMAAAQLGGAGATGGARPVATGRETDPATSVRSTLLFADRTGRCEKIDPGRFASLDVAIAAYQAGGEPALAQVAEGIRRQVPDAGSRLPLLQSVVDALCKAS